MATGDETKAGPRPSLPPPGIPPLEGSEEVTTQRSPIDETTVGDGGFFTEREPLDQFAPVAPVPEQRRRTPPKPQILAPQANEWATNQQEVEVVKGRRTGFFLLFLLALLVVAVLALFLALRSVLNSGDDTAATAPTSDEVSSGSVIEGGESVDVTTPTTVPTTVLDPNQLQVSLIENPFICDGGTRQFAELGGAAPNEEVTFNSPQSANIKSGTADANGALPIRWQCDPEQAGTTWELTAAGVTSGKSATFIFAGVTAPATATTTPPALVVDVIENPFKCNGESRIFGGLTGASPGEQIAFTSPQASGILNGTADGDGATSIRWQCDPDQVGTTWELTATGVESGRTVTFSFAGS
ncbi:MAG: hypothetical protein ACRBK7_01700 [Acidimicrobiales bacterium]